MKIQIICENCNKIVELVPLDRGNHAHMSKIEEEFRIHEIELDYDHAVDEIEDVTAQIEDIRIDCKSCGEYIVLNQFPSYVYR